MSCRTTTSGSVAIALAKVNSDLDDAQVQSLLHQQRHRYDDHPDIDAAAESAATREQHRTTQSTQAHAYLLEQVRTDLALSARRRATLTGKLQADPPPDLPGDLSYAILRLRSATRAADREMTARLLEHARATGGSLARSRTEFTRQRAKAPGGRRPHPTAEQRHDLTGLPQDPASRDAFAALRAQQSTGHPRPAVRTALVPVTPLGFAEMDRAGYNPDAGLAEIHATSGLHWRLHDVPPQLGAALTSPSANTRGAAAVQLLTDPDRSYRDAAAAEQEHRAFRCDRCGRWRATRHTCPDTDHPGVPELTQTDRSRTLTTGREWLRVADTPRDPVTGARSGPVTVPVYGVIGTGDDGLPPDLADTEAGSLSELTGTATLLPQGTERLRVDTTRLACTCPHDGELARCAHIARAAAILTADHTPSPQPNAKTTSAAPAERPVTAATAPDPRSFLTPLAPELSTVSYRTDPAAFADQLREITAHTRQQPGIGIAYSVRDGVLYGPGADRSFGIEVEYQADPAHRLATRLSGDLARHDQALLDDTTWTGLMHRHDHVSDAVRHALHSYGILEDPDQHPYRFGAATGYPRWVHEDDPTAAGELVSPPVDRHHQDLGRPGRRHRGHPPPRRTRPERSRLPHPRRCRRVRRQHPRRRSPGRPHRPLPDRTRPARHQTRQPTQHRLRQPVHQPPTRPHRLGAPADLPAGPLRRGQPHPGQAHSRPRQRR